MAGAGVSGRMRDKKTGVGAASRAPADGIGIVHDCQQRALKHQVDVPKLGKLGAGRSSCR